MASNYNKKIMECVLRSVMSEGNVAQGKAIKSICESPKPLFITGKGGTGKTYFLKRVIPALKNAVVVAPTGIAAVNAGGQTIHSFFRIGMQPYIPEIRNGKFMNNCENKFRGESEKILQNIRYLIIDEISMVRPDLLDNVADVLRLARGDKDPFGGVKLIMIGDLFQLPPVVKEDFFMEIYDTSYFFSSKSLMASGMEMISFEKIYRQKDEKFISVLNKVRDGEIDDDVLSTLNGRCIHPENSTGYVELVTTNAKATAINEMRISSVPGQLRKFEAAIKGDYPKEAPVEKILFIKEGSRVMITRNGEGYVNGSLGVVSSIKNGEIEVVLDRPEDEDHVKVLITPCSFDKVKYVREGYKVKSEVVGSITQYPIKAGYSITIHKCIDGDSPIFTDRGIVKMRDININDRVNIGNGDYRNVIGKVNSGIKETIKITTKFGYEVICTKDHKILDYNLNFKEAKEFNVGEFIPISRNVNIDDVDNKNMSIDWLIGYIIGDGSYGLRHNSKSRIDICVGRDENSDDAYDTLKKCLDLIGVNYHIYNYSNKRNFVIENINFRKKLLDLGLGYDTNENKKIPSYIYNVTMQQKSDLIRGLFDADGCCNKNGNVILCQSNYDILKSIQLLLLEFGIISSITKEKMGWMKTRENYHLYINKSSLNNYRRYINFNLARLRKSLDRSVSDKPVKFDMVPNIDIFKKECKYSPSVKKKMYAMKYLDYNTLRMADELNPYFSKIKNDNYYFDTINSIESVGYREVFDIEVDTDHHFVSGGIVCSNCQGLTLDAAMMDVSNSFETGQLYTALSRVKSLDGLYLRQPIPKTIKTSDPVVVDFYKKTLESNGVVKPVPMKELEKSMIELSTGSEIDFSQFDL